MKLPQIGIRFSIVPDWREPYWYLTSDKREEYSLPVAFYVCTHPDYKGRIFGLTLFVLHFRVYFG